MSEPHQEVEWRMFESTFGSNRMEEFLKYSNGSTFRAQQLYVWNGKISASLWEVVSYLEIAIRAVVDSQFDSASPLANWLDDPLIIKFDDPIRDLINQAKGKARIYRPNPTREQILEQLPLGFLQALLSKRYLHLWPTLASGFRGSQRSDHREISFLMSGLRTLRNRIGHHNQLLDLDLSLEYENLLTLAAFIRPDLGDWLKTVSRVPRDLSERPTNPLACSH